MAPFFLPRFELDVVKKNSARSCSQMPHSTRRVRWRIKSAVVSSASSTNSTMRLGPCKASVGPRSFSWGIVPDSSRLVPVQQPPRGPSAKPSSPSKPIYRFGMFTSFWQRGPVLRLWGQIDGWTWFQLTQLNGFRHEWHIKLLARNNTPSNTWYLFTFTSENPGILRFQFRYWRKTNEYIFCSSYFSSQVFKQACSKEFLYSKRVAPLAK